MLRMGQVEAIFLAPAEGAPTHAVDEVRALAGVGLDGDRYAAMAQHPPQSQLTLIEAEAIAAANAEHGLTLAPGDPRRNVVTRGVALNDLVGAEFAVGEVRVRGVKLCEPCSSLEALTGQPVIKALVHRGGLNAEILSTGTIKVGDEVRPLP
jgi:MOSC domain-containing protein YiiM